MVVGCAELADAQKVRTALEPEVPLPGSRRHLLRHGTKDVDVCSPGGCVRGLRAGVRLGRLDGRREIAVFLSTVTDRGATPALLKTMSFTESRLRMIAENVANMETPGYRTKQLDTRAFQSALRAALDARGTNYGKLFVVEAGSEVATNADGTLRVTPSEEPVQNILFHDRTNMSLERQMADLAETGMTHEMAAILLRGNFSALQKAIRGTV